MSCNVSCLRSYSVTVGVLLLLVSLGGIGFCLFMMFGDPFAEKTQHTYTGPNWEDIGPAFVAAIISLLANLCLIGGAKQNSKEILLFWIVWKILLIIIFWVWYCYSQLKYHGYIDWREYGMRRCYWCDIPEVANYVALGGAACSLVLIVLMSPVFSLRIKLKKLQRQQRTEYEFAPVVYAPDSYPVVYATDSYKY